MAAASSNRTLSFIWLVLAVFVVPFGLAYTLFNLNRFEIGLLFSLLGLLVWIIAQGAGWRRADKGVVVIRKGPGDELNAYYRKPQQMKSGGTQRSQARSADPSVYLFIPWIHAIEAILPSYGFGFEITVQDIDTQTAWLSRIGKIRVHVDCRLLPERYLDFYLRSSGWLDRIKHYEEHEKLSRTDIVLWKKLLSDIAEYLIDNAVREVVWRWSEHLQDQDLVDELSYKSGSDKGPDVDPYCLSRNRLQLEKRVVAAVRAKAAAMGIELAPLVFELIEIDPELIKKVNRNKDNELKEANHKALQEAELIRQRGFAEAEVRAKNLALLLDELLNNRDMSLKDALVTDIVRAALYTDGKMIWSGVIEKGTESNGTAKTA